MNAEQFVTPETQPSELVQPAERALHRPAEDTQSAAVLGISARESGNDTAPSHLLAVRLRMVSTVAVQDLGPLPRVPYFAAHARDSVHDRDQFLDVVNVGTSDRHGQGGSSALAAGCLGAVRSAAAWLLGR